MKTLALIDDDPDSNLLLETYLGETYKTKVFESAIEALNILKNSPPDLILMDISMPDMNGTEALKQVRNSETLQSVPVIAITGYSSRHDEQKFLDLGFNSYISKPFNDINQVLKKIEGLIND